MILMMTESQRALFRNYGVLVGRVLLGLLFLVSGWYKLTGEGGVAGFAGMLVKMGLPAAALLAWVVVLIEIVGGAMLIVGYRVGLAAGALIIFLVLTVILVHNPMKDPGQLTGALKNLSILGGLLYAMAYGAGEGWKLGK
jgi:putative oxidoreductase